MKKICLLFISLLGISTIYAQEGGVNFREDLTWKQVLVMAAKENKPVFLDCYTTWCGPCKAMTRKVFNRTDVGSFMNTHFIAVKKDMEKGEGKELYKKYEKYIPGFPTYLLFNPRGELIHQVAGYQEPADFIAMMKTGLNNEGWLALNASFEAGQRDWPFMLKYLTALNKSIQIAKLLRICDTLLPTLTVDQITNDSSAYAVFRQFWADPETPLFRAFMNNTGIYMKYHEDDATIQYWVRGLYRDAVSNYVNTALKTPEKYDSARAHVFMQELRASYVSGSEALLASLLISEAVWKKDYHEFDQLMEAASRFALMNGEQNDIIRWSEKLALGTVDKQLLQICLKWSQQAIDNKTVTPGQLKQHLVILERMGDSSRVAAFKKKVAALEEEFERRAAAFHQD